MLTYEDAIRDCVIGGILGAILGALFLIKIFLPILEASGAWVI